MCGCKISLTDTKAEYFDIISGINAAEGGLLPPRQFCIQLMNYPGKTGSEITKSAGSLIGADQDRICDSSEVKIMEVWDVYDVDFRKIPGKKLIRGEPVPKGVYHLVCDVIVKHIDGTYLLIKRDFRKKHGGMWEASAGGSALTGEDPFQCAVRELREETGLRADKLSEVGRCIGEDAVYVEFLYETNCDKEQIILQEGETISYKWVSAGELREIDKEGALLTDRMKKYIKELNMQK